MYEAPVTFSVWKMATLSLFEQWHGVRALYMHAEENKLACLFTLKELTSKQSRQVQF